MPPPPHAAHAIPVFDSLGEPGWLVRVPAAAPWKAALRAAPAESRAREKEVDAWWVDEDAIDAVLGAAPAAWCAACEAAPPCPAWDRARLEEYGFEPRDEHATKPRLVDFEVELEFSDDDVAFLRDGFAALLGAALGASGQTPAAAAAVLGCAWPCDAAAVRAAFKRSALACHPDRGGDAAAMDRCVAARRTLLEALGDSA